MSLANEMAMMANVATDTDATVQKFWEKSMNAIRGAAAEGRRELCFYDCIHMCDKDYSNKVRDQLVNKLERNGFKVKKGYALGKGMGSWETPYVVW